MLIPTSDIANWRDLQDKVAMMFKEMGYYSKSPRVVELGGRGKKEVDVYIKDERASVNQIMLVECKFWSSNVSQDAVHSMHTVMQGSGANTGFIISKKGFQEGAPEAASSTNIHLLTWEQLQHTFGRQWYTYKSEMLEKVIAELRRVDHAHLAQFEPIMTMHNNMFFDSTGQCGDLSDVLVDIRMIILAAMAQPKTYDKPGPIQVQANADFPRSVVDSHGLHVVVLSSVRDYFDWIMPIAKELLAKYEALSKRAHEAFEALSDSEGDAAFERSLYAMAEETPIRVFRKYLDEKTYTSLLAQLRRKQIGR